MGGLTRGAFYHHFKSKEEVFEALCEKLFDEINPFEKAKQHKELNGLEKLKFVITYTLHVYIIMQYARMSIFFCSMQHSYSLFLLITSKQ